jgi:hypothetical protein
MRRLIRRIDANRDSNVSTTEFEKAFFAAD